MSDAKALSFELELHERPVTIGGEAYVLVELDGKQRDRYLNGLGSRLRVAKDGKAAGVKNFDGLQASLVAASLKRIIFDGGREPVTVATIQAWPAQVVSGLFDAAKVLSALGDEDEDEDKDKEGND